MLQQLKMTPRQALGRFSSRVQVVRKNKIIYLRWLRPVSERLPVAVIREDLRRFPLLGKTRDGQLIYLCRFNGLSPALHEVGRLRELTFRAVGEGTGTGIDVDEYDYRYEHLVLWNEADSEVVGAYRLANGSALGESFYSETLFSFQPEFLPVAAQALELGRSFVQQRYQGSMSLDYLWQGIGLYLQQNPGIRYLFGPVSMSGALPGKAKKAITSFFSAFFGGSGRQWVQAGTPFKEPAHMRLRWQESGLSYSEAIRVLQMSLKQMKCSVPVLYRQYADVAEPEGVHFCGFNVDYAFGGCIDAFIVIDLHYLKPARRRRYLG